MLDRPKMSQISVLKKPQGAENSNEIEKRLESNSKSSFGTIVKKFNSNSKSSFGSNTKTVRFVSSSFISKLNKKPIDDDEEMEKLIKEKRMHEEKIMLLKQETNNVVDETITLEHLTDKKISSHLISNKVSLLKSQNVVKPTICNALNAKRRASVYRRKSSVFKDIYEIKNWTVTPADSLEKSIGFSKTHLFDVYLDGEEPHPRNERLPSIINFYNKAKELRIIQKYNPTTVNSFSDIIKTHSRMYNENETYDYKSKSVILDGVKIRKTSKIHK